MNDYLNLLKEYEEINSDYKSIKSEYNIFGGYLNQFISAITLLEQTEINEEYLKDNLLLFFIEKYKNSVEKINQLVYIENANFITPLKQVCMTQNIQMKKILGSYEKIKNDLFEGKLKLNNSKKEYIEILKEKDKIKEINKDKKDSGDSLKIEDYLLYDAKQNSSFIVYKYQLEKLNEKIKESNEKYKELKSELDSMNKVRENTYQVTMIKFDKIVGKIGKIFIELEKNIEDKLFNVFKDINRQKQNNESEIIEIKERFQKEKLQTKEDIELILEQKSIIQKDNQYEDNIEEENKSEEINKKIIERMKSIDGLDFEIMNEPITLENPELIKLINEDIIKLFDEKEISSSDISQLLENINIDKNFAFQFIEEIKKYCKDNIINLKNEQNFIHLYNLFNQLFLSKDNNNDIIEKILELSQVIKYKDIYISSMIRKKNKIISSKKFWINHIENKIIYNLKEYIKDINDYKSKDIKIQKYSNKNTDKLLNILNNIIAYKKLNKKQKNQAEDYAKEKIIEIISNSITIMSNFYLPQHLIMDIFNHYVEQFELGIETYYYFENISSIKIQKSYLKMNSSQQHSKEKYGVFLNKEQLIILNAATFLHKNDYIKLFKLNKFIYSKIRKYLMWYRVTFMNISLEERIRIWEIILNLKEIRKKYDYNLIKKNYMNNSSQNNYYGPEKKRFLKIIDLDLDRTPLFNSQETHKIKANFILKCAATLESDINYFQGINYILLFLYQVLNYNEEETFYFLWALIKESKYIELFSNEMKNLKTYFKVFEKIIKSNYLDIYYSLLKKQIITQFYATHWFVTLFCGEAEEFEKEKTSKFLLLAFESFLFYRWVGILNMGLTLCLYNKDKILNYNASNLTKFMVQDLNSFKNINKNDFPKIRQIFIKNSEKIDETYLNKAINIINFEEEHPLLKKKEM